MSRKVIAGLIILRIATNKLLSLMRRNHLIKVLTFRQQISLSTRSVQMRASRSIQVRKFLPRSSNVRRLKKSHNDPKRKKWANDWKARSQDLFTRGIKETNKWVVSLGLKALYLRSTKVTRTSNQETKAFTRISPVPPTNPPIMTNTFFLSFFSFCNFFKRS